MGSHISLWLVTDRHRDSAPKDDGRRGPGGEIGEIPLANVPNIA